MTARRWVAAVLLAAAALTGCGLPLEGGVRSPGPVSGEAQEPGRTQPVPKPPQPDAGPRELVEGFLLAQISPDDDHAVAREFLGPEERQAWDDSVVLVRSPDVEITVDPDDPDTVVVAADVVARIAEDGTYQLAQQPYAEVYRAGRGPDGALRLVEVPDGLLLTPQDTARSFAPSDVYFVRGGAGAELPRLVPDRVFLPVDADPADALVQRLLAGPSSALTDAVTTAFPDGTALRRPVTTADGVVTVDLTPDAAQASPQQREDLSAQLVWTLRGAGQVFTELRLLVDGRPLPVDGVGAVQDRDDWPAYDPGRADSGPALLVRERRLALLTGTQPSGPATDGTLAVDAAVASPAGDAVAVLTRTEAGDEVRTGALRGPYTTVVTRPRVTSMSWGSGDEGLWLVEGGPQPQVRLVLDAAADAVISVAHTTPPGGGPLTVLRVSRDGARAAAVFGEGAAAQAYVGRVERPADGSIRLAGFRPVAPGLTDVVDVAWESGTSLVVLGALGTTTRLPVRVAVDGSELDPVRLLGLDGVPETVTVAPGQPLVVGTRVEEAPVVFVEAGGLFREPVPGSVPRYPG